jgi:hypothetical protein
VSIPPVPLVPAVSYDDAPGPDPRDIVEALSRVGDALNSVAQGLVPTPQRAMRWTGRVLQETGRATSLGRWLSIIGLATDPGSIPEIVGIGAGGMVGASIGKYLGGALGSATCPVAGTVVGGIVGGIIGGAVGGAFAGSLF